MKHVSTDFLGTPDSIAAILDEHCIKPDVVFFYAYIQPAPKDGGSIWANVEELVSINSECPWAAKQSKAADVSATLVLAKRF